jgi:hypothetical protein
MLSHPFEKKGREYDINVTWLGYVVILESDFSACPFVSLFMGRIEHDHGLEYSALKLVAQSLIRFMTKLGAE